MFKRSVCRAFFSILFSLSCTAGLLAQNQPSSNDASSNTSTSANTTQQSAANSDSDYEEMTDVSEQPVLDPQYTEDPGQEQDPIADPIFGDGPIYTFGKPYFEFKDKLREDYNLDVTLYYTWWWQAATDVNHGDNHFLYGRTDAGFTWTPFSQEDGWINDGSLTVWMRNGTWYDTDVNESLGQNIGSSVGTDAGYSPHVSLNLLYWQQWFLDNSFGLTIGKIHPNALITLQPVANDESTQFFADVFDGNNNPLIGPYAPGMMAQWEFEDLFHIRAAVIDMGDSVGTTVEYIDEGYWGVTGEIAITPTIDGLGKGSYGVAPWWVNMPQAADAPGYGGQGMGVVFSFNQEVYKNVIVFGEYGYGNPKTTNNEQMAKGGIGFTQPFGRENEMFGFAGAWTKPSDDAGREQGTFETFYRMQLTKQIQFTPDMQFIVNPSFNDTDFVAVFGLRLRIEL